MPEYTDDEVLGALEHARGYAREVLVRALGRSTGTRGPERLREIASPDSGEHGWPREAAMLALVLREGAAATPVYMSGLRDRSMYVRSAAAHALAESGDERATDDVLAWMNKKLGRKNRAATLDYEEVRAPLRFAYRNGALHGAAKILVRHWDNLDQEEHDWLNDTWPDLFVAAIQPEDGFALPDEKMLDQVVCKDHRSPYSAAKIDEINAELLREFDDEVTKMLARAR